MQWLTNRLYAPLRWRNRYAIALLAVALAATAEWIAMIGETVFERILDDAGQWTCPPDAALPCMVWDGALAARFAGFLAVFFVAGLIAYKLYISYFGFHRLENKKLTDVPDAEVLILPVSRPGRGKDSVFQGVGLLRQVLEFAQTGTGEVWRESQPWTQGAMPDFEVFCDRRLTIGGADAAHALGPHFTWLTGVTIVRALAEKNASFSAIHLVPSNGSDGTEELARTYYGPLLVALMGRRCHFVDATSIGADLPQHDAEVTVVCHRGVAYPNFEKVQQAMLDIVDRESAARPRARIVIDVTGGTAAFSATAAIASARPGVVYCHVPEEDGVPGAPRFYDVIAEHLEPKVI